MGSEVARRRRDRPECPSLEPEFHSWTRSTLKKQTTEHCGTKTLLLLQGKENCARASCEQTRLGKKTEKEPEEGAGLEQVYLVLENASEARAYWWWWWCCCWQGQDAKTKKLVGRGKDWVQGFDQKEGALESEATK